jgi:PEP-CTERM motif
MRFKKTLTGGMVALLAVAAGGAQAALVDFEGKAAFSCDLSGTGSDSGMKYDYGFAVCYYSPAGPADFPTAPPSTVMATGFSDTTFSLAAGGAFDLLTVDLAFGPFDHGGLTSDTTEVIGTLVGGGTVSTVLTVDYSFDTYTLGWTGLRSVVFKQMVGDSDYLAFDNMAYAGAGVVPEPTSIALVLAGLAAVAVKRRKA